MPKIKPNQAESYLCTPIRMDTDATYYIVGFKPNATKMTAHHMLIYGCDEPGNYLCHLTVTDFKLSTRMEYFLWSQARMRIEMFFGHLVIGNWQ